ncbi:hypothetical protein KW786_02975 [Candidatus Parcubacteria bacterium]|nr:hypothetical protein [Candidatus Parcubacteria bacterium]
MKHMIAVLIIIILALGALVLGYFFLGWAPVQKKITWGINFSQMQVEALGLDWHETYLAILEDLGAKDMKLMTQWDFIEGKQNDYFFQDIDWQIQQAEAHGARLIYVVGMKTGRWPECHQPAWVSGLSKEEQQRQILEYVGIMVNRYKGSKAIVAWQAENEPLFNFGVCPSWYYDGGEFLKKEVALIKSLDPTRPVMVSDSGEQSLWFKAAKIGDRVGTTMYRKAWVHITDKIGFPMDFILPPVFYYRKAELVKYLLGKDVFCGELQAEPWAQKPFPNLPLEEQEKTMDLNQFKSNVEFAKRTGLNGFYFWGTEWWYWLKTTQNKPEIWNEAKKLF